MPMAQVEATALLEETVRILRQDMSSLKEKQERSDEKIAKLEAESQALRSDLAAARAAISSVEERVLDDLVQQWEVFGETLDTRIEGCVGGFVNSRLEEVLAGSGSGREGSVEHAVQVVRGLSPDAHYIHILGRLDQKVDHAKFQATVRQILLRMEAFDKSLAAASNPKEADDQGREGSSMPGDLVYLHQRGPTINLEDSELTFAPSAPHASHKAGISRLTTVSEVLRPSRGYRGGGLLHPPSTAAKPAPRIPRSSRRAEDDGAPLAGTGHDQHDINGWPTSPGRSDDFSVGSLRQGSLISTGESGGGWGGAELSGILNARATEIVTKPRIKVVTGKNVALSAGSVSGKRPGSAKRPSTARV